MSSAVLRRDEAAGLALALAAHAALVAWLVLAPPAPAPLPPPERMTVSLSDEVGLTQTAPLPAPEAAPAEAPRLGETASAPEPVASPEPARPEPAPVKPVAKPQPLPVSPKPAPRPLVQPQPRPQPQSQARPKPSPAKPSVSPAPIKSGPTKPAGANRVGKDFLNNLGATKGAAKTQAAPAAAFGPQQQSALRAAIMRQLKPHWSVPQGTDAEKLVTQLRFSLNRNGMLVGDPQVIGQSGRTPANAAQVSRHAEQAIRAVRLAQPFILPSDLYEHWQTVTSTFDRRLSQ